MKKLILTLLLVCHISQAGIIPQPHSISFAKGNLTSVISGTEYPALLLKKLNTIPQIAKEGTSNLEIKIKAPLNRPPTFKIDESYQLNISASKVVIEAENEYGALYALESLQQLLETNQGQLPVMQIKDKPRFPWRGLLIDVVRHWVSLDTLKKEIDFMARVKMNVLHLHLSDDQGFRVESKVFPKLYQNNHDDKFYTQEQIKELIQYASERGVRVVPEFDVPGHVTAIIAAYPELATLALATKPSTAYGPHDAALHPLKNETYEFLEQLFKEMSVLFPDEFFHVGGDEVTGKHWLESPEIKKYMEVNNVKDVVELQFMFTKKMETMVKNLGKKMIAWDEVLKEGADLDSVAQIWRGPKFAKLAMDRKMPVLYSYGYYLDLQLSSETHYLVDPTKDMGLKKDSPLLWGGESAIWSERVNDQTISSRIWPRNMAIAERLWSKASTANVQDFYQRQADLMASFQIKNEYLKTRIMILSKTLKLSDEQISEFVSWLEPGKFYSQHRYRKWTTETRMSELVDALPSESLKATHLKWDVEHWLKHKDQKTLDKIKAIQKEWLKIFDTMKDIKDPETLLLVKDFKVLATMLDDSLTILKNNEKPGSLWPQENRTRLSMTGHLRHGMYPAMHSTVLMLVNQVEKKFFQIPSSN